MLADRQKTHQDSSERQVQEQEKKVRQQFFVAQKREAREGNHKNADGPMKNCAKSAKISSFHDISDQKICCGLHRHHNSVCFGFRASR
jgi:hypothetical protein